MNQTTSTADSGAALEPATGPLGLGEAALPPSSEGWRRRARRFAANPLALAGLVLFIVFVVAAITAPFITPANYDDTSYVAQTYAFPSSSHFFGIDAVGRDFFSRNIYAIRVSLAIGLGAALISALIGIPLGAIAGYYGGKIDWSVSRVLEVFQVIPPFMIAILLSTLTGGGIIELVLIISFTSWMNMCRLVRADLLSLREEDFVLAAHAMGIGTLRIIVRHLLPNALGPILVAFSLTVPAAIATEAGLSFLGVGVNPPTPSWGSMIAEGLSDATYYWQLEVFPVLLLTLSVLSLSFIGDGVRDALDPSAQ